MVIRQRAIQAEDKQERHNAILDAAERLLLHSRDRVANVAEVADEAGLGKGTVYLYFPSKEELLLAVHERRIDGFFRAVIVLVEQDVQVAIDDMLALTSRHLVEPPLFLPLASRCFGLMAHSIPPETAVAFRQRMAGRLERAGAGLERHFPALPPGGGVDAAAPKLRAHHRPLADVGKLRRRKLALRDGRSGGLAGFRVALPDRTRRRAARAVAGHGRRAGRFVHSGTSAMNATLRILAMVLLAAAAAGCAKHEALPEAIRPVTLVQVTPPGAGDTAVFAGEVKPRHETDLAFRIGGKLLARDVDVGTRVRKGQMLARLDPADVGLQADAANAQLAATKTEYEFAKAEFDRYQGLLEQKFVSASALDAKRNVLNTNLAKFEQAKANLAVTRNQAGYATLVAPSDGVVTSIGAEAGQVIAAGQAVMRLAREDEREIAIAVPEARVGELARAKQIVVALAADPRKPYRARIREVSPAVDPMTRTFAVRVSVVDPDPALQWGMTANVALIGEPVPGASLLPLTSIYHGGDGQPAVWTYDPPTRKVGLRPIVIAQYREDGVVIGSGVAAGEWVVASGANKLYEGQSVRPYEAPGRPSPPTPPLPVSAATKN